MLVLVLVQAPLVARRRWKTGVNLVLETAHADRVDNLGHRVRAISTFMDGERRNVQHQAAIGIHRFLAGWKTKHGTTAARPRPFAFLLVSYQDCHMLRSSGWDRP